MRAIAYMLAAIILAFRVAMFIILRYCVYGVWLPAWIILEGRKRV